MLLSSCPLNFETTRRGKHYRLAFGHKDENEKIKQLQQIHLSVK